MTGQVGSDVVLDLRVVATVGVAPGNSGCVGHDDRAHHTECGDPVAVLVVDRDMTPDRWLAEEMTRSDEASYSASASGPRSKRG